jgi:cation diffusion facilitator family transporter
METELRNEIRAEYRLALTASSISVFAGAAICLLKFAGYYITGSHAILSDALESIINVLAALFSAFTIRKSISGVDRFHPYGKGRLEYFSAGFEGGLIALAGIVILYESIPRIFRPDQIRRLDEGIFVVVIATVGNALLGYYLVRTGKRHHREALIADGHHIFSDVITSIGMIGALIVVYFTGIQRLDPVIASAMAVWILFSGFRILRSSFYRLVDRISPETLAKLVAAMEKNRTPPLILPHRLRLRESGPSLMLDFHVVVPNYCTVKEIHDIETGFSISLARDLGREVDLMMHTDPCIPANCKICSMPECPIRSESKKRHIEWTEEFLLKDVHHPFEGG